MAKISIVSRKIHHLITTLFIDPTYLHQRMKGSQKVEELKLTKKWSIQHMMNVDLLLNQEIKYIIPIWKKAVTTRKQFASYPIPIA